MEGVFSVNIVAFLFALIGAALNMFQSVIRTPVPGSSFTGSMYDAVMTVMTNGLPDEGGTVLAILILGVLFLVPVIAAVSGLFIPFSKSKRSGIILCLCALINALAAWGIYYLSSEIFVSPFLSNYVAPYAQKVSFITPAIWAAFYLVAGVLILRQSGGMDISQSVRGPSVVFSIGWTDKKNARSDLDASAFLRDANGRISSDKDVIFYDDNYLVHGSCAMWLTGDVEKGNIKQEKIDQGDIELEQIIVLLDKVPSKIHEIIFAVTVKNGGNFGHPSSAYARLVDQVEVSEEHIKDKTLRVDMSTTGRDPRIDTDLKDKELANKDALVVAEIHRKPNGRGWGCKKIGVAMSGGFDAVCRYYKVKLA